MQSYGSGSIRRRRDGQQRYIYTFMRHVYVCVCVCIRMSMCVHIYIPTYIYTYTQVVERPTKMLEHVMLLDKCRFSHSCWLLLLPPGVYVSMCVYVCVFVCVCVCVYMCTYTHAHTQSHQQSPDPLCWCGDSASENRYPVTPRGKYLHSVPDTQAHRLSGLKAHTHAHTHTHRRNTISILSGNTQLTPRHTLCVFLETTAESCVSLAWLICFILRPIDTHTHHQMVRNRFYL
jgi:hypothetical protein